jgi:hypothetical protein
MPPNGRCPASGQYQKSLRVESLEERTLLAVFTGADLEPSAVTAAPDKPMIWGKSLVDTLDASLAPAQSSHLDSADPNAESSESAQDTGTSSGDVTFPDYLEPNSQKSPRDLGTGDKFYPDLSIDTTVDEDWFRWTSSSHGSLDVKVLFTHAQFADIDLQVYNGSGTTVLGSSTSVTNDEEVTIGIAAGQSYLIRVWGFQGSINFDYDLVIDELAADIFEDNDNPSAATNLGSGDAFFSGLTINVPNDDDWYKWYAHAGGSLTVSVFFTHGPGRDIDLQVYNAAGTTVLGSSTSVDNDESVTITVAAGQTYQIRVYGYSSSLGNYSLSVDGPIIPPDGLEPNDTPAQATNAGSGDKSYPGLTIHGGIESKILGDDWFIWTAPASGALTVDVLFTHAVNNDVDLEVLNLQGNILAASRSVDDNEQVTLSVAAGQSYRIHVFGFFGDVHHDYDLVINGPEAPNILPDIFEDNDNSATATNLGSGDSSYSGLTIDSVFDGDWYRWVAPADGTVNVDVLFSHAAGNVDLHVRFAGEQSYIAGSFSHDDNEHVMIAVTAGQSYDIVVYGDDGDLHPDYDLVINGPEDLTIQPDRFENNDTPLTATDLGSGDKNIGDLTIDKVGDDDWYRWLAPVSGPLVVDVLFEPLLNKDVDLYLYDSQGSSILALSTQVDKNEQLAFDVTAGVHYLIRIYGGSVHPHYDLMINGPEPSSIQPDVFEDNDTALTATDLGGGDKNFGDLTIDKVADDDWYRWLAPASGPLVVDVLFEPMVNKDVDLYLYDSQGNTILAQSTQVDTNEQVAFNVTAGENYLIRISGGSVHPDYDLIINGPEAPNIQPDVFEDNDTSLTATDLGSGDKTYSDLTIDKVADDDWYRWSATASGQLVVDVLFEPMVNKGADLYLYDSKGNTLAQSKLVEDNEHVAINVTAGQSYLIRLFAGSAHPDYALVINGPDTSSAADFNMDGRVDGNDFLVLQAGVGITSGAERTDGDADGDGDVDSQDFEVWQAEFSKAPAAAGQAATVSAATVPDTSTAATSQAPLAGHSGNVDRSRPPPRRVLIDSSSAETLVPPRPSRESVNFAAARRASLLLTNGRSALADPIDLEDSRVVHGRARSAVAMTTESNANDEFFEQLEEDPSLLEPHRH